MVRTRSSAAGRFGLRFHGRSISEVWIRLLSAGSSRFVWLSLWPASHSLTAGDEFNTSSSKGGKEEGCDSSLPNKEDDTAVGALNCVLCAGNGC